MIGFTRRLHYNKVHWFMVLAFEQEPFLLQYRRYMANTYKILGQSNPAATTDTEVYKVGR